MKESREKIVYLTFMLSVFILVLWYDNSQSDKRQETLERIIFLLEQQTPKQDTIELDTL